MTPDRIEKIVDEYLDMVKGTAHIPLEHWLRTTLTQLQEQHEIEKQEMYESLDANYELIVQNEKQKIRDRIASLCYQLDTDGEKMYQLIYKEV